MIIVSDTSPLSALLTINQAELLKVIFGEVIIPNAVCSELLRFHPRLPEWLRVQAAANAGPQIGALQVEEFRFGIHGQ